MGGQASTIPPWHQDDAPENPVWEYDEWGYLPEGLTVPTQRTTSTYWNPKYGGDTALIPNPPNVGVYYLPTVLTSALATFGSWPLGDVTKRTVVDDHAPYFKSVLQQPTLEGWDANRNVCNPDTFPSCSVQPMRDGAAVVELFNGTVLNTMDAMADAITTGYDMGYVNGGFDALEQVNVHPDTSTYDPCDNPGFFEVLFPIAFGVGTLMAYDRFIGPTMQFEGAAQAASQLGAFGFGYNYALASMMYGEQGPHDPVGKKYETAVRFLMLPFVVVGGQTLGTQLYQQVETQIPEQAFQIASGAGLYYLGEPLVADLAKALAYATFGGNLVLFTVAFVMKGISKLWCWMTTQNYEACRDTDAFPTARRWDVLSIAGKLTDEACEREGWTRDDPRAEFIFRALVTGPFMMRMAMVKPGEKDVYSKNRINPLGSIYQPIWAQAAWLPKDGQPDAIGEKQVLYELKKVVGWAGDESDYQGTQTSNAFGCQNWDVLRNAQQEELNIKKEANMVKTNFDRWIGTWDDDKGELGILIKHARNPELVAERRNIPGLHSSKGLLPTTMQPKAAECEAAAKTAMDYAMAQGGMTDAVEFIRLQNPMCYQKPFMSAAVPVGPWITLFLLDIFASSYVGDYSSTTNGVWGQVQKILAEGTVPNNDESHYYCAQTWLMVVNHSPDWIQFAKEKGYTPNPDFVKQAQEWIDKGPGEPTDPGPIIGTEPVAIQPQCKDYQPVYDDAMNTAFVANGLLISYKFLKEQFNCFSLPPFNALTMPFAIWIQLVLLRQFGATLAHEQNQDENHIWDQARELVGFFTMFQEARYYLASGWYKIVKECPDWVEYANATKQKIRMDILDTVLEWMGDPPDPPMYPVGPVKPPPSGSFKPLQGHTYGKSNASYNEAFTMSMTPGQFRNCLAFIISQPKGFYGMPYDNLYASEVTWTAYNVLGIFAERIVNTVTVDTMDKIWIDITNNIATGRYPATTAGKYGAAYQWWQCCFESPDWVTLAKTTGMTVTKGNRDQAWQWIWDGESQHVPGPGDDPFDAIDPPPVEENPISAPGDPIDHPQGPVGEQPQVCLNSAIKLNSIATTKGQMQAAWDYIQTLPQSYYTVMPDPTCSAFAWGQCMAIFQFVYVYVHQQDVPPDTIWGIASNLARSAFSGDKEALCAVAKVFADLAQYGDYAAYAEKKGWTVSQATWDAVNAACP